MPSYAKVFDICLRTKAPISDIYQGLPVYTCLECSLDLLCEPDFT